MGKYTRRRFFKTSSATLGTLALSNRFGFAKTSATAPSSDLTLWYEKPSAQWIDALPIGNSCLGAMVFGGGEDASPSKELLQLNEDTLWSGKPVDGNNPDAKNHLADVRRAVLEQQDYHLADEICRKMQGFFAEAYQPLGNLRIDFSHSDQVAGYRRELNLDTGCACTTYTIDGVQFECEAFVSAPDQVIVFRVAANKPNSISCTISLDSPLGKSVQPLRNNRLLLTGKAPQHVAGAGHANSEKPVVLSDEIGEGMHLLAVTGIFGMAFYSVSKRLRELGIRIALGAQRGEVLGAALGRALQLLAFGSVIGLLLGIAATRLLGSIVYQATPRDPLVLAGVVLAMLLLGLLAIWIPAQRALKDEKRGDRQ